MVHAGCVLLGSEDADGTIFSSIRFELHMVIVVVVSMDSNALQRKVIGKPLTPSKHCIDKSKRRHQNRKRNIQLLHSQIGRSSEQRSRHEY